MAAGTSLALPYKALRTGSEQQQLFGAATRKTTSSQTFDVYGNVLTLTENGNADVVGDERLTVTDYEFAPPAPPVPIAPPAPVVASEELAETDAASDEDEASAEEEASALDDASDDEALVEPMPPIPPAPVVATELLASVEDAELASEELSEELMDDVEAALDEDCVEDVATEEPIPVVAIVPPAPPCGGQPMFDSRQTFPLDVAVDVGVTPSSQAEQRIANASGVAKEVRRFLRISYSCN